MEKLTLGLAALAYLTQPALAGDRYSVMSSMLAVATFNTKSCPGAKPNHEFIAKTFKEFGVDPNLMSREPFRSDIINEILLYEKDVAYNCEATWTMFGPAGIGIQGLLVSRR